MMTDSIAATMPLPLERLTMPRDSSQDHLELRRLRESFKRPDGKPPSQKQMALMLETSAESYSRWERGITRVPYAVLELMRCWAREDAASKARRRKKH